MRFAGQSSLQKCTPQIHEYLKKRSLEYYQVTRPQFRALNPNDVNCIYRETRKLLQKNSSKAQKKYQQKIRAIIVGQNRGALQRSRHHFDLDQELNQTLKEMFIYDPMAIGSYLISDSLDQDLVDLCATIQEVAKMIELKELELNAIFTVINVSALLLFGAALIIGGPLTIAVSALAISTAIADGSFYLYKEGKYRHAAESIDYTGTQSRFIQRHDEKIAFAIFKQEMDERFKQLEKEASARFWRYFAFSSAVLGSGLTTAGLVIGHLPRSVGGLSRFGGKIVERVAQGGRAGEKVAEALYRIAKSGEKAMVDLIHAVQSPNKFYNIINKAISEKQIYTTANKIHGALEKIEKVAGPIDHSSATYWATSYSRATLVAISRVLRAAHPKTIPSMQGGISYRESSYSDLSKYIRSW